MIFEISIQQENLAAAQTPNHSTYRGKALYNSEALHRELPMATMLQMMKEEGRAEGFAEGMAAGMLEVRRGDLVKVLRVRFPDISYEMVTIARGMTDLDQLARWFEAALVAPTKEMFPALAQDADQRSMLQRR